MKKIIALSIALIAAPAFAANNDVCAGGTAAANGTTLTSSNSDFVVTTFTPKCSANVFLSTSDNTTTFAVGAASAKGKSVFSGNTEGGAVAPTSTACASSGCTATNATEAAQASLASASGS